MWAAASQFWTAFSAACGGAAAVATGFVGWRAYKAKTKVDTLTLAQMSTDDAIKHLQAALARTDIEAAQARQDVSDLRRMLADEQMARLRDNTICDEKIRKLGTIVKSLGGEVPDELNGLR